MSACENDKCRIKTNKVNDDLCPECRKKTEAEGWKPSRKLEIKSMDESASRQIEDLKDEIRGLTRALEVARELIPADAARNQEALEWIARQFCDRTDDADKYVCMESGDCITEYCLSCYARAVLRAQEDDER